MNKIIIFIGLILFSTVNFGVADIFESRTFVTLQSDKSSVSTKEEAIKQGRYKSLLSVLKKITSNKDYKKLEEEFTLDNAYLYETRFSVSDEKIIKGYYEANIMFYFNRNTITEALDKKNIPYILEDIGTVIIILDDLPENSNISENWFKLWNQSSSDGFLSTIKVYKRDEFMQQKDKFVGKNLSVYGVYEIALKRNQQGYNVSIYNLEKKTKSLLENISSLVIAKQEIMYSVEQEQKQKIFDSYAKSNKDILFKVDATNFNNWIDIENKLKNNKSVKQVQIAMVEENDLYINLIYLGDIRTLKTRLAKECINLDLSNLAITKLASCS